MNGALMLDVQGIELDARRKRNIATPSRGRLNIL
jgi:hypothetical protein